MLMQIHQFSGFYMLGAIWLIQLVHYPAFLAIAADQFNSFHKMHTSRLGVLVGPIMVVELATGLLLLISETSSWSLTNLLIVLATWICTFTIAVPLHNKLSLGFDQEIVLKLIRTNWIRTLLWSAKAVLAVCWLYARKG